MPFEARRCWPSRPRRTTFTPNQITDWKNRLFERAAGVFDAEASNEPEIDLRELHAKIGQLTLENDFLESSLTRVGLLSAKRCSRTGSRAADQTPRRAGGIRRGTV